MILIIVVLVLFERAQEGYKFWGRHQTGKFTKKSQLSRARSNCMNREIISILSLILLTLKPVCKYGFSMLLLVTAPDQK